MEDLMLGVGMLAGLGVFFFVVVLALYVYSAYALMTIAKKLGYDKPWLAWIPIANFFLLPILAGWHWAWGFVMFAQLIPFIGPIAVMVLSILWLWKICEKRNFHGAFSLLFLVPIANLVMLGLLAWMDR